MNIAIVSGSPRMESVTHRIALHLQQKLSETGHSISIVDVREHDLPLLQSVFSSVEKTPEKYKALAEQMFAADAFILVTPEYNAGYSPALQNLFDHFPKQTHKTFGIVTGSVGGLGGMRSTQQLFLLIAGLFGIASPNMLVTPFMDKKFDAEGNLLDPTFAAAVDNFIKEFVWLAERVANN